MRIFTGKGGEGESARINEGLSSILNRRPYIFLDRLKGGLDDRLIMRSI